MKGAYVSSVALGLSGVVEAEGRTYISVNSSTTLASYRVLISALRREPSVLRGCVVLLHADEQRYGPFPPWRPVNQPSRPQVNTN